MIPEGLLEKRLREGKVHHPRNPSITVQIQQTFYFGSLHINELLRDFYGGLAAAIFSGTLRNRQTEGDREIEPDLTSTAKGRYIEVKAAGRTRRVMLKDDQMAKYLSLQLSEDPIPHPRIYFVFFRYGTRGIQKALYGKSQEESFEYIARDTKFMVGLPLSIVHSIHHAGLEDHPLAPRTYGEGGVPCTNFSTLVFDSFFSHPEKTIRMFSLYPGHYQVKRRKIGQLSVNGTEINPFPLVLIKATDEHHASWIKQVRKELLGNVPF
jgi:hypothetical protein